MTQQSIVDLERGQRIIEDFPLGYPRFSALVASHNSFHLCRRFSGLRARLLLLKQDKLSLLEKQLEKIDRDEGPSLSLGSCRRDTNSERHEVLAKIQDALADYDEYLERHQRALYFESAPQRAISNLRNWISGTGCVARNETAYLEHDEDLVSLATSEDFLVTWLEAQTGNIRVCLNKLLINSGLKSPPDAQSGVSRDPKVHIFSPSSLRLMVRIFVVPFITILLLTPVITFSFVNSLSARLIIVVAATMIFVVALSSLTRTRIVELIVAGATYTTVLVVFISGTGGPVH
ncbi:hypothetical protein GL218_02145 [Daldinia childiae]|uniref:uncharacterized protein n=1 Tax=Daldinia childiae TaxID=326645 RepID=UPI001446B6CB|nr:uncharacterized protein GL218_02145 [Daldinia childiae]KAF3064949.1 hypothetical protein GL218_02145 [Daldinia childiae]